MKDGRGPAGRPSRRATGHRRGRDGVGNRGRPGGGRGRRRSGGPGDRRPADGPAGYAGGAGAEAAAKPPKVGAAVHEPDPAARGRGWRPGEGLPAAAGKAGGRAVAWARVPATSANLGPGFDCLGLALGGWELRAWLEPSPADPRCWTCAEDEVRWHLDGRGPAAAPPEENLVVRAVVAAFARAGQAHPPAWRLTVRSTIPPARGLGSSAAAIVAGLAVAGQWLRRAGRPLSRDDLLQLAAGLEGHADNVAAALFGGAVVAWREGAAPADGTEQSSRLVPAGEGGRWRAVPVPLGRPLAAVVAIPAVTSYTHEARRALPETVGHSDAAFNAARAALLIHALVAGRTDLLAEAMQDRLHQPYRTALFPWLADLIQAAVAAGAGGACLSGAGPSVLALVTDERAPAVAEALAGKMVALGLDGKVGAGPAAGPGVRSGLVRQGGRPARCGRPAAVPPAASPVASSTAAAGGPGG